MDLALITVFSAGLLTLLTPCILPMLPVYFTLLLGEGIHSAAEHATASHAAPASGEPVPDRGPIRSHRFRLLLVSAAFVAGFSVVFTLLGMAASAVGGALQQHRSALLVVGGGVILGFGLRALGVVRIGWLDRTLQPRAVQTGSRLLNAFWFGLVFALGWTPCVGPVLGSVLTYTAATTNAVATGAAYLFVYSLGVGVPLLLVSAVADRLVPRLRRLYRHLPTLERVTGGLMVVVGLAVAAPPLVGWLPFVSEGRAAAANQAAPKAASRPQLIEFYADRCPVCDRVDPFVRQLQRDCVAHRVDVIQVEVSDPRHADLVRQHAIRAVPTFVLVDPQGTAVTRLYGERSLSELRAAAASLIDARCAGEAARDEFSPSDSAEACATGVPELQPAVRARGDDAAAQCAQ